MELLVATTFGAVLVDLETEEAELVDDDAPLPGVTDVVLPLLVAADQVGTRIVAVVDRRPPLVISDDSGSSWNEAGGGLPAGVAIAIDPAHPDWIVFASDSRLYLSDDGGRFWRSLEPELIGITAIAFA